MWYDYITESAERNDIDIGEILKFLTGSSKIPATGFDSIPKIGFTDRDYLPVVSTCDIMITFPRNMGMLDIDAFKEKIDFCILESHDFGAP